MLRSAPVPVLLSGLLLASTGGPSSKPALPLLQTLASAPDVPALAHLCLTAPHTVFEGEIFLVEIALADGQGRPLAVTHSVQLRSSGRRVHLSDQHVRIENGRGRAPVQGASTRDKDLYIIGRCALCDGTYLAGVSNTIAVLTARS